jgi:hypothetical protein
MGFDFSRQQRTDENSITWKFSLYRMLSGESIANLKNYRRFVVCPTDKFYDDALAYSSAEVDDEEFPQSRSLINSVRWPHRRSFLQQCDGDDTACEIARIETNGSRNRDRPGDEFLSKYRPGRHLIRHSGERNATQRMAVHV